MTPQTPSQFRNAITLRIILAWAILLSPLAAVKAEKSSTLTAEPSAVDSLTPQSVAALTIRPAQLFSNPVFESLPIEVVEAASQKYLGISSTSFARITAVVEPPMGIQPYYAIEARLTEAMTLNGLHDELKDALDQKMTSISIEGRPCLKADQAAMPCIYMPDDYTILIAPMGMLNKLLRQRAKEQEKSDTPPLAAAMTEQGGDQNDLHAALRMEPILPLIQLGMTQVRQEVEPKYRKYLAAIEMIKGAVLAIDISGERDSALTLYANSEEEAEQLNLLLDDAIELFRAQMFEDPEGPYVQLAASGDPVQEAAARYIERAFETEVAQVRPQRQGTTGFDLFRIEAGEIRDDPLIYVAIIGVLVALLLPAVQAAREAARRNASLNNMKQLVVSMLNYESERKFLPTQAIYDDDESPLLSWRVAVLPYLGEQALYDRFLLDEPWDSPHNIQLLPLMPEIFIDPSSGLDQSQGKTHYLGVTGPKAAFTGTTIPRSLLYFRDGTSRTIVLVQVDDAFAVEWTKPADYNCEQHDANPIGGIGGTLHIETFLAAFCDGSVRSLAMDVDPVTLRALFTPQGGEQVELP